MARASGRPEPPPAADLDPLLREWATGVAIDRCHSSAYGATEFNASRSSGRFRPFTIDRRTVPTAYGADSFDGALSETVFHDVPPSGPGRAVLISSLLTLLHSRLSPRRTLRLVDLTGYGPGRIGLTRRQLIESPASEYAWTARWARALFECLAKPDGLIWVSRQYDRAQALMLFGGRVSRRELDVLEPPRPLAIGDGLDAVRAAAEKAGILLVE